MNDVGAYVDKTKLQMILVFEIFFIALRFNSIII